MKALANCEKACQESPVGLAEVVDGKRPEYSRLGAGTDLLLAHILPISRLADRKANQRRSG